MRVLVTGGAGFIGSNLADRLVADGHAVRILDDLSTGFRQNLGQEIEFIEAHVADYASVREAVADADVVLHQAAHRAVLRSVDDPLATDKANVHGTLTVLEAARDAGVERVVVASSSSVYGGATLRPTREDAPLLPRSPYAVTKLAGEHYCRVFSELFGLEVVALRYFNVYGPRQRPDAAYAAVIPLFIDALVSGQRPIIHGDGFQTRDFTYIDDVVAANLAAIEAPSAVCRGTTYNIAGGAEYTVLHLLGVLGKLLGVEPEPLHVEPRSGDVRHSQADAGAARVNLSWEARVSLEEGLARTVEWFTGPASENAGHASA